MRVLNGSSMPPFAATHVSERSMTAKEYEAEVAGRELVSLFTLKKKTEPLAFCKIFFQKKSAPFPRRSRGSAARQ